MKSITLSAILILLTNLCFAQQWRLREIIYERPTSNVIHPYQSILYQYSEARGSDYKNNIINFDTAYSYTINTAGQKSLSGIQKLEYNADNRVIFSQYRTAPGIVWYVLNQKHTEYTATGKEKRRRIFSTQSKAKVTIQEIDFSYNSNDDLIKRYDTSYVAGDEPMNGYTNYYKYDSSNNLIAVYTVEYVKVLAGYDTTGKWDYRYDSNGAVIESTYSTLHVLPDSFLLRTKREYIYDTNKLLTEYREFTYSLSSTLTPSSFKKYYSYQNNTKPYKIEHYAYNEKVPYFFLRSKQLNTYNSNNDIVSEHGINLSESQIITSQTLKTTTYNQYGQPDTITELLSRSALFPDTVSKRERHIYEIYWPTNTEIINKADVSLILYPNPSSDIITIRADVKEGSDFYVAIYNMNGNVVKSWTEKSTSSVYLKSIPIIDLPSGNYILKIDGKDAQGVSRFTVTK